MYSYLKEEQPSPLKVQILTGVIHVLGLALFSISEALHFHQGCVELKKLAANSYKWLLQMVEKWWGCWNEWVSIDAAAVPYKFTVMCSNSTEVFGDAWEKKLQ